MNKYLPMPILTMHNIMRFWNYVEKTDYCWLWTGCKISGTNKDNGYGRQTIGNKQYLATRISYWLHYHDDPEELDVCHQCNNPPCVNPEHLFIATRSIHFKYDLAFGFRSTKGALNPKAKLREDMIPKIRELQGVLTAKEAGSRFGVSDSCIEFVWNRHTWGHVL